MAVKTWSTPVNEKEEKYSVPCTLCGGKEFVRHFTCTEKSASGAGRFYYVRCTRCGLVQINPQPQASDVARRYGANYGRGGADHGADYLAYERANEGAFLRLQELALTDAGFFELEQQLRRCFESQTSAPAVLDIGCATGALLAFLKERGWAVSGLEISAPQAAYCLRRGLDVAALPLEQSAFPAASFDAVTASHLIEHLTNPGSFVREAHRICKPGGRIYITTPNITGFQARLFGSRWRSAIFDHLYLFSVKTLRALLESSGFTVERVRTWGGLAAGTVPAPVKRAADILAKTLGCGDVMIMRARRNG